MLNDSLIEISMEALAKHKISIDELNKKYNRLDSTQEANSTEIASIDDKISQTLKEVDLLIEEAIAEIDIPEPIIPEKGRDGIDFDEKIARTLLTKIFKEYVLDRDISIEDLKKDIKGYADTLAPSQEILSDLVKSFVTSNSDMFKGKDGSPGTNAVTIVPKDGTDGIGIADITIKDEFLIISMSDGSEKRIPLPEGKGAKRLVGSPNSSRASFLSKSKDVRISSVKDGHILVYSGGVWTNEEPATQTPGTSLDSARIEIEALYKFASATAFKKLTYTGDNITDVSIFTDETETSKLFTKIIGYNVDNNIDVIQITDEVNGGTIVKTLTYTGENITSVSSSYTA